MHRPAKLLSKSSPAALFVAPLCLALALGGCPEGGQGEDAGSGGASFSIEAYPALVNTTPYSFGGRKPKGTAIFVDGLERLGVDDSESWELDLDLAEGENSFLLSAKDASGASHGAETVSIGLDTVPPAVLAQVPAADASGVPLDVVVQVSFSEPVDCGTVNDVTFSIQGASASASCDSDDPTISLTPSAELSPQTGYTVLLFSDVADPAGNSLVADLIWSFTTGDGPDDVPPLPPSADNPAPSSPTFNASMSVGGSKEAGASVEVRWQVGGSLQQDWTEIVGKTAEVSWSHNFALELGQNSFSLRSVDQSNNVSTTTTDFTVQRDANPNAVDPPTVEAVVSPTAVGNQVLRGTKVAGTSIRAGGRELVPLDDRTSWTALVQLSPGSNNIDLVARDASGNESDPPLALSIVYNPPGEAPPSAQIKFEFDLNDLWDYIGDEFAAGPAANNFNNYGFDIWLEGPITPGESCVFDGPNFERRHTRYVATVVHGCAGGGNPAPPAACPQWWWEPNYRAPNYLAALIEHGWWENVTHPIPRDVDRRNQYGETWQPGFTGNQVNNPQLYYPCVPPECPFANPVNSKPKMFQRYTDGITEATTKSGHAPGTGPVLGDWTGAKSYVFDLRDWDGNPLQQGPYLVTIALQVDRSGPAKAAHYADYLASDRETCWDDPAHDSEGAHRAEAILNIGPSDVTLFLPEKGHGTVDACHVIRPSGDTNQVKCHCNAGDPWPCPDEPTSVPALQGGPQHFFNPDKFQNPLGDGVNYPVKVSYCASGCP